MRFEEIKYIGLKEGVETYSIEDYSLVKFLQDVIDEGNEGSIPILEVYILLHTLTLYPFHDKEEVGKTLLLLRRYLDDESYLKRNTVDLYLKDLETLRNKIEQDYLVNGKVEVYDNKITYQEFQITPIKGQGIAQTPL